MQEQEAGGTRNALRLGHILSSLTGTICLPARMKYNETPRTDIFTQGCRDLVRTFTYEAILACTVYLPPMLFMVGPGAIVIQHPLILIILHSVLGFGLSRSIHRMGHCLLMPLPKAPQKIYFCGSLCLPVKLTLSQFIWMMEILVAAGVFCGIIAKRLLAEDLVNSLLLFGVGFVLYFTPVYLTRLWTHRYYPGMTLLRPTEAVIKKSFPGLRSLFQ